MPFWKSAPFLRLIIPLVVGIIIQWYLHPPAFTGWSLLLIAATALLLYSFFPPALQFYHQWWNGVWIHILLIATGLLLTYYKNISNHPDCLSNSYTAGNRVLVTIREPLSAKSRSYKALASVGREIRNNGTQSLTKGNILLYFKRDSTSTDLRYGSQLIIAKPLQPIRNSGNPGCFDYQRYCSFRDIQYQVFLQQGEYVVLKVKNENLSKKFLFAIRQKTINILKKYIPGDKENGFAAAILIGYKDDLDKDLYQSYSNTGVVHVIAISGLHLGLVYWLLTKLLHLLLRKRRSTSRSKAVMIITGLWLFALIAGGSPSVLRAAVMFSCLVIGDHLIRKSSVYNTLSASAFLLLCYNPFWLWDAGFQLSYAAVLSIVLFMKPIYNCLYFRRKLPDYVWKLMAVTLSAQILTVPISIFHFHQFPVLFLLTNLLAVPLAGIILTGELALCITSPVPAVAHILGKLLHHIIHFQNDFIEKMDAVSFSTINGLQFSILQVIALYLFIAGIVIWLLQKNKPALFISLFFLLCFSGLKCFYLVRAARQAKMVVYNVPHYQAIDFIAGSNYFFAGDSTVQENERMQHFHLRPSRILYRVSPENQLPGLLQINGLYVFGGKTVLLADKPLSLKENSQKIPVDIIILSKNVKMTITQLVAVFKCKKIVIDSSNPPWATARWKADCKQWGIPCHNVSEEGAFVFNLY